MKKTLFLIFAIFFAVSVYGCGVNGGKSTENLTHYTINVTLNEDYTLSCKMQVDYTNTTGQDLKNLKFNMYPSAFREASTQKVISMSKYNECYYNGEQYGGIEITSSSLPYSIGGADENILCINLQNDLKPYATQTVDLDFTITLPNINHRFGYAENTINIGNAFPTLCVFENGEFTEITYTANGDPFYSATSNYDIVFTYPAKFILASSGTVTNETTTSDQKTTTISAPLVRDVALVLSEKFNVISASAGKTKVNYYYFSDKRSAESLETATLAMKTYSKLFGAYPYPVVNVVEADFCIGGMEFPGIVLIGTSIPDYQNYTYVIVHELAHQWWYGVVGNNQTAHAWLDESLAEYSSALFFKHNTGYAISYDDLISRASESYQLFYNVFTKVMGSVDTSMTRALDDYATETEYVYMTYLKGMLMYDTLAQTLGEKTVIKCLKEYYSENMYTIATPNTLILAFERVTNCSLRPFFDTWLQGKEI